MVRKITLLAGVSMLAASCSGGSDAPGMVSTADTTPPAVTVTPSSASIEGGETVAITATATDTVDGSVTPTLSCTAGTLTGNLLVTTAVAADTTITCTGTATDKAGNKGTATTTITVKATVASVTSLSGSTLAQGQLGAFTVTNLPLAATSYTGKLGTRDITLRRGSASALTFLVPADMPAGTHLLDFQVGARRYSYSVNIAAAPAVADPKAVVVARLNEAIAVVDSLISREGAAMSAGQRNIFAGYRTDLSNTVARVDTMSAAELGQLAAMLQVNLGTGSPSAAIQAQFNGPACTQAVTRYLLNKGAVIVLGGAGLALILSPEPTITKIGGLAIYLVALNRFAALRDSVGNVVTECLRDPDPQDSTLQQLLDNAAARNSFVEALAVAPVYGFNNKKSKSFNLIEKRRMDPSTTASFGGGMKELADLAASLPFVPDALARALQTGVTETTRKVPSSEVSLGAVSNGNVVGVKSGSGDTITLTFSYVGDPPSDNVPFNFTLTAGTMSIPLSGQLVVALPGAEDAAVTLIQGKAITSQLQVRGADSIEIVKAPTKGAATISPSGLLSYTPNGQAFGKDEIQYRARNADGVSRTATVLLTINRQFEGTWSVRIVSETLSQSQAGLCPNEDKTVSVLVSKVSDTQYNATYDGVPLSFTMASKDDPNGLRAQASGTFDDGPGQTTESLTVNIPNSTQLNGGSTWSYVGPGNTRCSGRTTVTGSK
ncbi:Ig-like domain-containing protein [Sphingomonas turrisvirgatae]|uniref:HYR domain-containing protein n=1 Tax=Sphingomonas turrisvirgatae TaxID=1888892 RepID=A0A1E3LVH2_9SPHN|nr:Ig-like domain-containing protein [Sphingomonas turrisvirgatae]ODP37733.1 hypothetical protein BFL28_01795 [Sphingomonas turrisvirgatae]